MKIANWNIERLKHIDKLDVIQALCNDIQADIFILTESDTRMELDFKESYHSDALGESPVLIGDVAVKYQDTERRISIFTNYKCVNRYHTFDDRTALCIEVEVPTGNLIVYGVIIGVLGNRHMSFKEDLDKISEDIRRLAETGKPVCIAGDFNCSFGDKYYFTQYGRETIKKTLEDAGIQILSEDQPECIDHIAVTKHIAEGKKVTISEWNLEKKLSDHKGIVVEF